MYSKGGGREIAPTRRCGCADASPGGRPEKLFNQDRPSASAFVWSARRAGTIKGFLLDEIGLDRAVADRGDPQRGKGSYLDLAFSVRAVPIDHRNNDCASVGGIMVIEGLAGVRTIRRR